MSTLKVFILRTVDMHCGQGVAIIAAAEKKQAIQVAQQYPEISGYNCGGLADWDWDNIEESAHLHTDLTTPQVIEHCCYIE